MTDLAQLLHLTKHGYTDLFTVLATNKIAGVVYVSGAYELRTGITAPDAFEGVECFANWIDTKARIDKLKTTSAVVIAVPKVVHMADYFVYYGGMGHE